MYQIWKSNKVKKYLLSTIALNITGTLFGYLSIKILESQPLLAYLFLMATACLYLRMMISIILCSMALKTEKEVNQYLTHFGWNQEIESYPRITTVQDSDGKDCLSFWAIYIQDISYLTTSTKATPVSIVDISKHITLYTYRFSAAKKPNDFIVVYDREQDPYMGGVRAFKQRAFSEN